jgi:fatty-acyl-CoA synthase
MLFRMGLIDLPTARGPFMLATMWVMLGAVMLGLVGLVLAFVGGRHRSGIVAVLVTAAAGMSAGGIYSRAVVSPGDLPPIHDVQTDWSLPIAFTEATLKDRASTGAVRVRDDALVPEGRGRWTGMSFAAAQAALYDDLRPLVLDATPEATTQAAARAMQRLGWQVTRTDPEAGVVEGVYRSPWYELIHDVAVRVVMQGQGSRVDIRSTSRLPGHDMGENAGAVRQLLNEVVLAL